MNKTIYLATLFLITATCIANDAVITGEGGRMVRLGRESTSVQMVREKIVMKFSAKADAYLTTVDFVFRNLGAATTVQMGFPESWGGVDVSSEQFARTTSFYSFETWVDGQRVKAQRQQIKTPLSGDEVRHWVKTVSFAKNQTRRVRVRYRSEVGGNSMSHSFATYNFTGGNWKGEVEESTLLVNFPPTDAWSVRGDYARGHDRVKQPVFRHRGHKLFYRWRHWQAEGDFTLYYYPTLPGTLWPAETQQATRQPADYILIENPPLRLSDGVRTPPSAFVYKGVTFIQISELYRRFAREYSRKGADKKKLTKPRLDQDKKTQHVMLHARGRTFSFDRGSARMKLDGKRYVRMPATPITITWHNSNNEKSTYVPMRFVLDLLKIAFTTQTVTHRYWLDIAH